MNKKQREKKQVKTKEKKKMKTWKKVLLIILLIILIFAGWFAYRTHKNGGGLSGMLATVVGHDENTKKNLPELRVLILGVSTDQAGVDLTDTIIVGSYNPNTQKGTLLSIPRDTYIGTNKKKASGFDKINSIYNVTKNPEDTLEAVNKITGLDIKYYVVVKTEALIELVDAIGGVNFNVPIDMEYDDPTQDLHIDLKEGEQLIDGAKAEQLLRFRHSNPDKHGNMTTYPSEYGSDDTGRMRTQREFITETLKQTLKPENIFKISEILEIAHKNLITNLELGYLKDYIPYAVEFNTENLTTGVLPGVNDIANELWFFFHDEEETQELIQKLFYDRDKTGEDVEDGTNVTNTSNSTNSSGNTINTINTANQTNTNNAGNVTTGNSTTSNTKTNAEIKIEVLNGTGDKAKLQEVVDLLKEAGYDVTKTGNTSTISKTIITNKKELPDDKIKEIKQTLGVGSIGDNKTLSSKVDVTIVIGKDFNS